MKREDLIKHWDVIEAFKNGIEIEYKFSGRDDDWKYCDNLGFYTNCDYRIKEAPKSEYLIGVPFDFSDAEYLIGKAVILKHGGLIELITAVQKDHVYLQRWTKYKDLFEHYTFLDGSICGKPC